MGQTVCRVSESYFERGLKEGRLKQKPESVLYVRTDLVTDSSLLIWN